MKKSPMRASALLDPGGFGCVPRDSGYLWTLGRLRLEAPRGRAPSGRHHNEPQVFVKRAEAPPGKTQELEYLFSSETFRFRPGSLGAVGARTEVPRRGAAPSRGPRAPLTAAGAQPALLRRGLGPRRGARRGWPGQAASLAPGSVKARPASPPAGSRTTEDPARLGRKGGAARSTSHSKATRKRDLGSAQWAHWVQDGDPPTLACCATLAAPTPSHPLRSRSPPAPGGAGKSRPPPTTSLVRHWGSHSGLRAPQIPGLTQTRPPGECAALEGLWLEADPQVQSGDGQLRVLHLGTPRVPHAEEGGRC